MMSIYAELRRRNVFRMAVLYAVTAWLLMQVTEVVVSLALLPEWMGQAVLVVLALGFPISLIFAWIYEITPDGLKLEKEVDRTESITHLTGRRMDFIVIALLLAALLVFAYDKWFSGRGADSAHVPSISIAVLPFRNTSLDPNQEYLSDGLAEDLSLVLAKSPELRVAARKSCSSFKGLDLEVSDIARRLRVVYVLDGAVRRSGDRLRISAQLTRASDAHPIWLQSYDRQFSDVQVIQGEIAREISKQLELELPDSALAARRTDSNVYSLYLRARHMERRGTADAYEQAVVLYRQALEIDPEYADAWTGLARAYGNQADKGLRGHEEGRTLALQAVNRALAIDPDSAQAHAERAWEAMYLDEDYALAARSFEKALDLAPNDPEVAYDAATLLQILGRLEEAIALKEFSISRDPVNPRRHFNLGNAYLFGGRFEAAVVSYRMALALDPEWLGAHYHIGRALLLGGDPEAALNAMESESFEAWRMVGLPMVYHDLGRKEEAEAALGELIRKYEKDAAFNIAYVLAYFGQPDRAFEWLEKAVLYADSGLSEIIVTPELASLHDDPRWLGFLRKLGKSPAQLDRVDFEVRVPD